MLVKRITVTLPDDLSEALRSEVPKDQLSAFVAEAARRHLGWIRQGKALEAGKGAWKDENHPDLQTHEDTVRFVRAMREGGEWPIDK